MNISTDRIKSSFVATSLDSRYREALVQAKRNDFRDNYDYRRFGAGFRRRLRRRLKDSAESLLRTFGLHGESRRIAKDFVSLSGLYSRLDDDASRELLVQLLAYRTLGHRKVRLPLNRPEYWRTMDELDAEAVRHGEAVGFMDWKAAEFDLQRRGYPLRLSGVSEGIHAQILLEQYRCTSDDGTVVDVTEGDVVVDGGGCYGETALFFALKAGPEGRVFSFEFVPNNLRVFERNLELNPALRNRVTIVPNALWSQSDVQLAVVKQGPGTRVIEARGEAGERKVSTLSIDGLVARHALPRVDFLKLDIEGAEREALWGAEGTLRQYRPRLAISVYHRLSDFWAIPAWLDTLGLDYRFYLRHFTIHAEETVLFAMPAGSK